MAARKIYPLLFVLLWATGFIGARYAMPHAEPFSFLCVRFLIAAGLFAAAFALSRRKFPDRRTAIHSVFAGILIHGAYLAGVFWAVRNGMPAGLSALLVGLQPILTAMLAGPVLGESVAPRQWAALAAGLAGVAMVLWPKLDVMATGVDAATLGACLVAVLAMSLGTVWQKRFVAGADLVPATMLQYVGGAALTGALALTFETGRYELTAELVFAMAWLVVVLSVGAVFLLMHLIESGAVATVASLFYLVPGVTAVIAYLLFGESLGPIQVAGMVVTAAAVAAATSRPVRLARAADRA